MAREYTEIKVKRRVEKRVDKTEDQEIAQVEAEKRASQTTADIEKRRTDDYREKSHAKADKKSVASGVKEKIADVKEKIL